MLLKLERGGFFVRFASVCPHGSSHWRSTDSHRPGAGRHRRGAVQVSFCSTPERTFVKCTALHEIAASMSVLSRRHSLTETIPLWRARRKCISTIKTKAQSGEAETKKEVTAFREVKALVNAHFITSFAMRLFPPTPPERCRSIAHSFLSLSPCAAALVPKHPQDRQPYRL